MAPAPEAMVPMPPFAKNVADDIDSDAGPLFFEGKTFDTVGVENNVL